MIQILVRVNRILDDSLLALEREDTAEAKRMLRRAKNLLECGDEEGKEPQAAGKLP
jgi:hypothetical protein